MTQQGGGWGIRPDAMATTQGSFPVAAAAGLLPAARAGQPPAPRQPIPVIADGLSLYPMPASAHTAPDPYANVVVPSAEERAALVRQKNRMAQRRFREKERHKAEEAQQVADSLAKEVEALRLENQQLELEHTVMQQSLQVCSAMLALLKRIDPADAAATGTCGWGSDGSNLPGCPLDQAAVQEASQQLAAAIGELPPLEQLERLAAPPPAQQQPQKQPRQADALRSCSNSSASSLSKARGMGGGGQAAADAGAGAGEGEGGSSASVGSAYAAEGHFSSFASVLEASAGVDITWEELVELGAPPGVVHAERDKLKEFSALELRAYWERWLQRLTDAYRAAEAGGFKDQEAVARLDDEVADMFQVFWTLVELNPRVCSAFLLSGLPPSGVDTSEKWERIAAESLTMMSEAEVANVRLAWQRLMKRSAMAAMAAKPWVQRLQDTAAASAAGAGSMQEAAKWHSQVAGITSRLHKATRDQFLASMAAVADLSRHISSPVRSLWNVAAAPHLPDYCCIAGEILRLHRQQKEQQHQQQLMRQQQQQ